MRWAWRHGSGKVVVAALPMPQGLSQTTTRIGTGADAYWQLFRTAQPDPDHVLPDAAADYGVCVFLERVAGAVSVKADYAAGGGAGRRDGRDCGGQVRSPRGADRSGEMGDLVRAFNHMAADLEASRQLAESSSAQLTAANLAIEERRRELETIVETIPSGVVTLDGAGAVLQSNRAFAALMGRREEMACAGRGSNRCCRPSAPRIWPG